MQRASDAADDQKVDVMSVEDAEDGKRIQLRAGGRLADPSRGP